MTTLPYISVFSKTYSTSPLTIYPWYSQKRYCYDINLSLSYEKCFRVTGIWPSYTAVVVDEAQISKLIHPLGAVFSPDDYYLFILFRNMSGVWPYFTALVISELTVATLLPPLGAVTLRVDGLF